MYTLPVPKIGSLHRIRPLPSGCIFRYYVSYGHQSLTQPKDFLRYIYVRDLSDFFFYSLHSYGQLIHLLDILYRNRVSTSAYYISVKRIAIYLLIAHVIANVLYSIRMPKLSLEFGLQRRLCRRQHFLFFLLRLLLSSKCCQGSLI